MTVPSIDMTPWRTGNDADRAAVAATVDRTLQDSGLLLLTGHGVPAGLTAATRAAARRFFALPDQVKRPYAVPVGGRGWLPPGAEANGVLSGVETPPDLKESYSVGSTAAPGDDAAEQEWHRDNVWPAEVPELAETAGELMRRMRRLSDDLLTLCAQSLGLPADHFTAATRHPKFTLNINRYPPLNETGPAQDGQFRIGPHTDFGSITVLDREPGLGGLQVCTPDGAWEDAPYEPGALTVNIGDMMARWTGDRWRSPLHRVLPPHASAPDEDLVSLVFFYVTDRTAQIESLAAPVGRTAYPSISAQDYLLEKLAAIAVS